MGRSVDPITTEVVARHALATAEEMGAVLIRAAYSPNIKERHDCSTAIFDAAGQVIAQAHHVPIHLGSMIGAIDYIQRRFGSENIRPGDMFVANDPYNGGGTHLPDINIVARCSARGAPSLSSPVSPITPMSAAWCRAASRRLARISSRKAFGCRRSGSCAKARSATISSISSC